jgi:hypothetical protein
MYSENFHRRVQRSITVTVAVVTECLNNQEEEEEPQHGDQEN